VAKLSRVVLPALATLALYYALFGGEYSVFELREARQETETARVRLDSLERVNDSLRARADSLASDPGSLERVAREKFGMIREGEVLYRFAAPPPDSAAAGGPDDAQR
jgi:cell division protein FtsB